MDKEIPGAVFFIPPGDPQTWPACLALDCLIYGDGDFFLIPGEDEQVLVSRDVAHAFAHLRQMGKYKTKFNPESRLWYEISATITDTRESYSCVLEYQASPKEQAKGGESWSCEGEGETMALAIAHALVDFRDWEPKTCHVWSFISSEDEDEDDPDCYVIPARVRNP
jgi:hypothetical protein